MSAAIKKKTLSYPSFPGNRNSNKAKSSTTFLLSLSSSSLTAIQSNRSYVSESSPDVSLYFASTTRFATGIACVLPSNFSVLKRLKVYRPNVYLGIYIENYVFTLKSMFLQ